MVRQFNKWIQLAFYIFTVSSIFLGTFFIMHSVLSDQVVTANTADDDTVDGEFKSEGYNNPVTLTKFTLEDRTNVGNIIEVVDETSSPASITTEVAVARPIESYEYLIPQQDYTVEFDLHDRDTFQDIESVELRLYYNISGSGLTNGAVIATTDSTPNTGTGAVIKWQRDTHNNAFFVHNTSSAVSWEVVNSTAPALNVTSESVTFEVTFKFSKVSPQSNDQEWHIGFNIIDSLTATGITESNFFADVGMSDSDPANATPASFNMAFYGEVELPNGQSLDWGTLKPGSDFSENSATTGAITFLSNGPFEMQISAVPRWQATNTSIAVDNAVLVTDNAVSSGVSPQAFGLKYITQGAFDVSAPNLTSESQLVDDFDVQTTEAGVAEEFTVHLAISQSFQNATYNGEIIFLVNNKMTDPITNPESGGS